jgi:hypothetical protein
MKLSELSKKPALIKLTIDNEDMVEKYGEALDFYMYDRQPLHVFSKIANSSKSEDIGEYLEILMDTILNEDGSPVMDQDNLLPLDLMTESMRLIGEHLGK